MLEQKIMSWKNKLAAGAAGLGIIAGVYGCAHEGRVPVRYYTGRGSDQAPIAQCSGISCCDMLNCKDKGKDYCRDDGEKWIDGVLYDICSCHDSTYSGASSGSTSSGSSRDWSGKDGGFGRESTGSSGGGSSKGGKEICFPK